MGNLRDENKLRQMKPTDVVLGADEQGCLVNFPPENFSGSIPVNIDTETGDGEELFTEPQVNDFLFKKIKSKDGSTDVITDTDGNIDLSVNFPPFPPFPEIPTVDYPVINGENVKSDTNAVGLYKQLSNKKIQLKSLLSNDIIITEVGDDIKLSLPGGGSSSYDWIIDPTFVRPVTWGDPIRNRKEEITYLSSMTEISPGTYTNGQVVKVANGTINDPFLSYEEYLLKRIYGTEGVNTSLRPAPYSKVYPSHEYMTVRIRNSVNTASHIEVQNTALYVENDSILTYTGARTYAIDYAELYDLTPVDVNGVSIYPINNYIRGEGSITRTNGFGIIRVKSDETKTRGKGGGLEIMGIGKGLNIIEGLKSNLYSPGVNNKGLPLYNGGSPVYVGNVQPTVPVIKIIGRPYLWWGTTIGGTKVMIRTFSQVGLELEGNPLTSNPTVKSSITSSAETLMFQFENNYIGYEKRITVGDSGNTTEENELISHFTTQNTSSDNYGFFYKPYEGYSMFKIGDKCQLRLENLSTQPNGFDNAKGANVFDISGSGQLYHIVSFSETGGGGAINLFRNRGNGNQITLTNAKTSAVNYYNIFKGDGSNNVSANIVDSKINSKYLKTGVGTFYLATGRSLTVLNNMAIIETLPYASDNADAISKGFPVSALYRDASAVVRQVHD